MFSIAFQEFKQLLLSFKALVIVLVIAGSAFFVSDVINNLGDDLQKSLGSEGATLGVAINVFIFGFVFIAALSHDTINREISSKTIRFLVTKTSRTKIILGKYLGILSFWVICMFLSYSLVAFSSNTLPIRSLVDSLLFISVVISFYMFISTVFVKTNVSLFIGIISSIFVPILSVVAIYSDKIWIKPLKYITPYNYSILGGYYILMNVVLTFLLLIATITIFERKDL